MRALVVLAVLAALGAGISGWASWRRAVGAARMRAQVLADVERGAISDLARAQVVARHLTVADPQDAETAAALAFADAALAVDYGLDTTREAKSLLARHQGAVGTSDTVTGMLVAARALVHVAAGDRDGGARLAVTGTAAAPGVAYPFYALGRARGLAGDLAGASRAMEAAIVRTPGFLPARLAWAEAHLDQGDGRAARAALLEVTAKMPDDLRARLLLEEADMALGNGGPGARDACAAAEASATGENGPAGSPSSTAPTERPRWPPAAIRTECALAAATRARAKGIHAEAAVQAERAAAMVPNQARLLGRTAETLAQLGLVDWAAALLERGRKLAAAETPALSWATLAVTVGRGRVPTFPAGPRPADPESRLLAARATLALGGAGALASLLASFPPGVVDSDRDLVLLSRLGRAREADDAGAADEPLRDYVDGLRAKLDGALPKAVEKFGHALSGHGDACRAAGEYVATMGLLKRPVAPGALTALAAENNACVNLR